MNTQNPDQNPEINRVQIVFQNYLEQAATLHPLPWRPIPKGAEWVVLASDSALVVQGCADWATAQAIVDCQQEEFETLTEASAP